MQAIFTVKMSISYISKNIWNVNARNFNDALKLNYGWI